MSERLTREERAALEAARRAAGGSAAERLRLIRRELEIEQVDAVGPSTNGRHVRKNIRPGERT